MPLFDTEKKAKRQGLSLNPNQRWIDKGWEALEGQDLRVQPNEEQLIALGKGGFDEDRTLGGTLKDIAITGAKGIVGAGEAAVGLADIPTFGRVGRGMEKYLGYDPAKTQEFLGGYYSEPQKEAFRKVEEAKGFIGTVKEMAKSPSTIGHAVVESAPLMLGGAAAARKLLASGALKMTPVWNRIIASAMGEGLVSAGATAEGIRQQTKDGYLTPKQATISAISGAGTALFAIVGGRVAQKFGIIDPDTFLAGGSNVKPAGVIKRIIGGGISEGAFEELPQSMQEQVWLNAALDKPLLEGTGEAGATGMLTGFGMGAGFNIFTGKPVTKKGETEDTPPPAEPNNLIAAIDESMSTGKIINTDQDFTPEIAMGIIKQSYEDKILSDADLESLGEKYPELKNDIIGVKIASKISIEVQDAEKVRREVEKAGIKERAEYLKRAGLPKGKPFTTEVEPLETARAKFFEAPTTKKEAADKARAKFFAAKLPGTISTEARAKKDEVDRKWKELIARKPFIPQKDISDKEYKEFWSEELDKAEYLRQSPEGLDALRKQLEAEEEAGNVQPEYAEWWRTKLDRMEQIRQSVIGKEALAKELAEKKVEPVEEVDAAAHEAATSPLNDIPEPTEAQIESGNYKKGHIKVQGLDISVENPEGSQRSGTDLEGKDWSITMAGHYGYFNRSEGKDGEQVDVFVNSGTRKKSDKAYIIDQVEPKTGKFDEHKVMLGYPSIEDAEKGYLANYEKGWDGLGNITEASIDDLKKFVSKRQTKPYAEKAVNEVETITLTTKPVVAQKAEDISDKVETEKPAEVEIPELQDTTQAKEFGKTATPEQISRLKELRQESLDKSKALKEQGKLEEAFAEVQSGQFYREAIQEAEMPVEEVAAEKEITFVEFEKQYKNAFKEMMKYPPDKVGSNVWSDRMAELSDAHPEWAERIEDETAKPQPSKPAEPKPSEAVETEIKAEATPKAAPKKPTPKIKKEKVEIAPEKELTFKDYQEKITKDLKGKKLSTAQLSEYATKEGLSYFGWVQTAYEALSPKTTKGLRKEIADLEKRKSKIKRDVTTRAQATTREANLGKIQGSIDAKQEALRALEIEGAPKEPTPKVEEEKAKVAPEKEYFITTREGTTKKVKGKPVSIEGFEKYDFFYSKDDGKFVISEATSGFRIATEPTLKGAKATAEITLDANKAELDKKIKEAQRFKKEKPATVEANKEAYGSQEKADAAIESVAKGISDKRMPDRAGVEESEVVKELRTKKRVDFTGRKLTAGNESQEIAELFQVYRSPKLEILHTIYTSEDGTILGHNAMTSGQIDYVSPGDMAKYMHGMKSAAKRLGATKVHVLHNHPSGNETMSQMDVNFAARISKNLGTQMGEFIVIDHGKFTRIQQAKNDAVWVDTGEFKMPEGIKDWTAGKVKISSEIQMAQFGASLAYDKTKAVFVYLGSQNEVQGWTIHDKKILTKGNIALKNSIQQQIKAHDATKAVLIADSPVLLKRIVVGRAVGGWLVDVQDVKGNSLRAEYPNSFSVGREFTKKAWGLFEPKPKYATKPTIDYKELLKRYAASKERTNTTNQTAEQDGSKYKGSSETGQASIENIMTNLRKVSKSDAVKYNIEKEQKIIKEYRKLEVLAKDSQASVASKQKMLAAFLKVLPTNVRAKVITPLTFISRYKEVKTHQKRIDEALYVTEKELSFYLRRSIMSDIAKGVKPKKLAKNRIKKDTIGHEAARDLQFIRDTLQEKDIASRITQLESQLVAKESELEEADESRMEIIEEQISDLQSHISIVETFGNIKSQALDDLIFAKEAISSIILEGRALWRLQRDAFKETLNPMITKVQQDISGQEEPTLETSAEATKRAVEKESILGKAKGTWDAVENSILSWEFLMNKLSKLSNSKIMQSYTTTEMGSIAQSATKQENILNSETDEFIHSNAKRIFNVETNNALNKKFIKQEVKQTGKVFSYKDGKQVDDFAISQMEAAYMYAIRKNQDSMPTFDKMGMTDKTFQEIEAFIGTELKTWVDFNVDEYLQDFHFSVNKVYRQVYGTNLTKTPGYISWYRDVPGKVQEKGIAASPHETGAKGMSKGAFKERVKNTNPYRFMSFNDVLTRHISEMNNFKAWAMPTKVISGVFNNRKTQRLIIQNHSANIRNAIKSFQTDFTKSPLEMRGEMAWLDKMRGNITTAMTALNPTIFLKQLTSIPAMAESIPTNEWIKYSVDFWANPLKAWRLLKESKHWESRRKRGMERDIRTAQAVSGSQAVANVRNLKNRAMFLVKWGDGAAILVGGYPVYKYHFDNNVKKVGKDKAHEFALEKFEEAMDRTQQASGIKDQGKFQRSGSYAKLFSMFLTAPKQYTSQITAAIRQIHSNPKDGDAYKRLFIFGVMMPSLFQATASGLIGLIGGDDDDEKKFISDQIKAILQSPLNGIPIIRDLQKGVWESAMGEWYGTNVDYSPVTSAGQSLMSAVFHGAKLFSDDAEKRDKHIEEAVNNVFETAGYAYGLPVETVRKMFMENWADIVTGKTDYPVRRALGFSRHATNEQDSKFTKEKRRLKKIKDEYVESKNKAAFRSEHFKDLRDYNRMNKLQGRLNKYRKKINHIKSRPETRESKVRIQRLEEIRTGLIKNYLGKR